MDLLLCDAGCERYLGDELARRGVAAGARCVAPGLVATELEGRTPPLAFARQLLADARPLEAASIAAWSGALADAVAKALPEGGPWRLHVAPHYGGPGAGERRARLIRAALLALLRRTRRGLHRALEPDAAPLSPRCALVQLLLVAPDAGFLSLLPAPLPHARRALVSPFPKGELALPRDPAPPSRAYAKLLEAERRLGVRIGPGERCVDLGASPGGWTHVALQRGAEVVAVDRAPLREDLMRHPALRFVRGDAFRFAPADGEPPVDWLLCDVVAAPERSAALLLAWARARRMRRFVVTLKFKGDEGYAALDPLADALPPLCEELRLARLLANRNEACAFGALRAAGAR